MVIQRIQSLYLLIACLLMGLVNFVVPIAQTVGNDGELINYTLASIPELMVLNLIIALVLFVAIFLFQALPLQMKVTRIAMVLIIVSALYEAFVLCSKIDGDAKWIGSAIMIVAALICSFLALKGMKRDYKLLHSSDRLR